MKIIGKRSVASTLYVLLQIGYFIVILGAIGAIIGFIVMMINPEIEVFRSFKDFSFLYTFPADYLQRITDLNIIHNGIKDVDLIVVGELQFRMANRLLVVLYFCVIFIVVAEAWIIITQLKNFLRTATEENPFEAQNIMRIRFIGLTILVSELAKMLLAIFLIFYLRSPVAIENAPVSLYLSSIKGVFNGMFNAILLAFIVLVISEVFRLGFQLKEEQELTI